MALPASGLYPIAVLALVVVGYGAASQARASGFLAVYVSAVMLGNARLPHGPATRGFAEGVGRTFTLVQGPTLPRAARRLGVIASAEPVEIIVEAAPLEELHADLLQAQIPAGP